MAADAPAISGRAETEMLMQLECYEHFQVIGNSACTDINYNALMNLTGRRRWPMKSGWRDNSSIISTTCQRNRYLTCLLERTVTYIQAISYYFVPHLSCKMCFVTNKDSPSCYFPNLIF